MKKRNALWVVGALAVAVALFAAIAFLVGYNSTDARIERAVAQIVEEYGFRSHRQSPPGYWGWPQRRVDNLLYSRGPVDEEAASKIVAVLREACPSCDYKHFVLDEESELVSISGGDPWREVYNFNPKEEEGGRTAGMSFSPNHKGFGDPEIEPEATLAVFKFYSPSLWQRIKEAWPW